MRVLIAAGLLFLLGTVGWWVANGAHRGWTQTSIPVEKVDPITEIEFTEYTKGLRPGVDVLFGGCAIGAGLLVSGWCLGRRKQKSTS